MSEPSSIPSGTSVKGNNEVAVQSSGKTTKTAVTQRGTTSPWFWLLAAVVIVGGIILIILAKNKPITPYLEILNFLFSLVLGSALGFCATCAYKERSFILLSPRVGKFRDDTEEDEKQYHFKITKFGLHCSLLGAAILSFVVSYFSILSANHPNPVARIFLLSLMGSFLLTFFGYSLYRAFQAAKHPVEYSVFGSLFVLVLGSASFLPAIIDVARGVSLTSPDAASAQFGIIVGILAVVTAGLVTSVFQQKDFAKQVGENVEKKIKGIKGFTEFHRHFQQEWAEDTLEKIIQLLDHIDKKPHLKMGIHDLINRSEEEWSTKAKIGWYDPYSNEREIDRVLRLKKIVRHAGKSVDALTYDLDDYIIQFWGAQESKQYVAINGEKHNIVRRIFVVESNVLSQATSTEVKEKAKVLQQILRGHITNEIPHRVFKKVEIDAYYNNFSEAKVPPEFGRGLRSFLLCDDFVASEAYMVTLNQNGTKNYGDGYIRFQYDARSLFLKHFFDQLWHRQQTGEWEFNLNEIKTFVDLDLDMSPSGSDIGQQVPTQTPLTMPHTPQAKRSNQ